MVRLVLEIVLSYQLIPAFLDEYPLLSGAQIDSWKESELKTILLYTGRTGLIISYCYYLLCYSVLHGWLSLLAELTNFNDRLLFVKFWDVNSLSQFWRMWNFPTHKFF